VKLPAYLFPHGPQLRDGATVLERINWLDEQAEWHRRRFQDALDAGDKQREGWHFRQYRWFRRESFRLARTIAR
jgi:hypothetical protein